MAHFGEISCVNYEMHVGAQIRSLFVTEEYVYEAIQGLMGITLNFDMHWCDALIFEAVVLLLVDIIDLRERSVELMCGFVKSSVGNIIANGILGLDENTKVSILKTYFQLEYYLPSDSSEDANNSEGEEVEDGSEYENSDKGITTQKRLEKAEKRERMKTFVENAWEIFRCAVLNGNIDPFRRVTNSDEWWFPAASTANVISLGEYAALILQALRGE
ncbi:hypothetical protein SUGI_0642110 [Cryptomeria japonica]|nr:hypothetical protein SUGI_0642110 [Cryptomeria japonica]